MIKCTVELWRNYDLFEVNVPNGWVTLGNIKETGYRITIFIELVKVGAWRGIMN